MSTPIQIVSPIPRFVPDDTDDDLIVATVIGGSADILCTNDRDLHHPVVVSACSQVGIRIMEDIPFIDIFRQQP